MSVDHMMKQIEMRVDQSSKVEKRSAIEEGMAAMAQVNEGSGT